MNEIEIPAKEGGGSFSAYIAMPEQIPAPAVIVIQEIFGVNAELRKKCDLLAEQGFIAVCPDLFWRMEPGVQLTDQSEEEWAKAFGFFNRFDVDLGVEDLRAVAHTLKGHADCTGKVGSIGVCLGGKLAYLMASRTNVDTSVGYYGVGIEDILDEAVNIKKPLMLHIAEEDEFVSTEAQNTIKDGLKDNALVTIYSYPGVNHAFSRLNGIHYDEEVTLQANQRTIDFLKNTLDLALAA